MSWGASLFSDWELPMLHTRIRRLYTAGYTDAEIAQELEALFPALTPRAVRTWRKAQGLRGHTQISTDLNWPPEPA